MNETLKQGLRDLLAFVESNDDFDFEMKRPDLVVMQISSWYLHRSKSEQKAYVCDLARRVGTAEKQYGDEFFHLNHSFGPLVQLQVASKRDVVCERVVVGQKTIPAHGGYTIPPAEEQIVDVVEWKCSPILEEDQVSA